MLWNYHSVTLHDLLLSKAGIIPYLEPSFEDSCVVEKLWDEIPTQFDKPKDQRLALAKVALTTPPIAPPGKKVVYSDVGWAMDGRLLRMEKI